MSLQKKRSGMDLLNLIPVQFLKTILAFSSILFFMNAISLILNLAYKQNLPLAAISFSISLILVITTYLLIVRNTKLENERKN